MTITAAQIRGARGVLNWTQGDLADRTDISATSIGSIESGATQPRESTLAIIQKAFEDAGIEFTDNDGVKIKAVNVTILKGTNGFQKFSKDVYKTLQEDKREILQAYVDDNKFAELLGGEAFPHVQRMEALGEKRFKILQKEGDNYFPAKNYAEYRWIPAQQFLAAPFIVFDSKLAIIVFEPDPTIIIINYPIVAETYRLQFHSIWRTALIPPENVVKSSEIPDKWRGR